MAVTAVGGTSSQLIQTTNTSTTTTATLDSKTIDDFQTDFQNLKQAAEDLDSFRGKRYKRELRRLSDSFTNLTSKLNSELSDLNSLTVIESDVAKFHDIRQSIGDLSADLTARLADRDETSRLDKVTAQTSEFNNHLSRLTTPVVPPVEEPPLDPVDTVEITPQPEPPVAEDLPKEKPHVHTSQNLDAQFAALRADFRDQIRELEKSHANTVEGLLGKLNELTLTLGTQKDSGRSVGSLLVSFGAGGGFSLRDISVFQRSSNQANGALEKIIELIGQHSQTNSASTALSQKNSLSAAGSGFDLFA